MVVGVSAGAAILVEGWSDQAALETLAQRRGWNLQAEGVVVLPIGGATNIGKFVQALGPQGLNVRLAGLYDVGEERHIQRSLEQVGLGSKLTRAHTEALWLVTLTAALITANLARAKSRPGSRSSLAKTASTSSPRR